MNFIDLLYVFSNKFLTFFFKTTTWIFINWNTKFVYNKVFRLFCINDFLKFFCQINALTWTFDFNDVFSNIFRRFLIFFENLNFWTSDLIVAPLSIFFEFFVFNANSNLWTFIISNASSDIFEKFRMLFNNVSLFYNNDKSLMFNVDIFS